MSRWEPMTPRERLPRVAEVAELAFWAVVAGSYPEANRGDFPPVADAAFSQACQGAVELWVSLNVDAEGEPSDDTL